MLAPPVVPAYEDGPGPARIAAENWPLLHLGLRDEDARQRRAERKNVEITQVIANDHAAARELAGGRYLEVQCGDTANAAFMQPLGAGCARSLRAQLAMLPETVKRCRQKSGQPADPSCQDCERCEHS